MLYPQLYPDEQHRHRRDRLYLNQGRQSGPTGQKSASTTVHSLTVISSPFFSLILDL